MAGRWEFVVCLSGCLSRSRSLIKWRRAVYGRAHISQTSAIGADETIDFAFLFVGSLALLVNQRRGPVPATPPPPASRLHISADILKALISCWAATFWLTNDLFAIEAIKADALIAFCSHDVSNSSSSSNTLMKLSCFWRKLDWFISSAKAACYSQTK